MTVDDFSRARIGDSVADGPSSRGAGHPFNHVVANVHGINAFWEQLNLKGIFIAGGGECLVPPACAFKNRGAYGLRKCAIHVIDDRLDRLPDGRRRIFFCQPMVGDKAFFYRLINRRGKIHVLDSEISGTWIEGARTEPSHRSLNEGNMFMNGNGVRFRRDLPYKLAWLCDHKR